MAEGTKVEVIMLTVNNSSAVGASGNPEWRCPNCGYINVYTGLGECGDCPGRLIVGLGGSMQIGLVIPRIAIRGTLLVVPGENGSG